MQTSGQPPFQDSRLFFDVSMTSCFAQKMKRFEKLALANESHDEKKKKRIYEYYRNANAFLSFLNITRNESARSDRI